MEHELTLARHGAWCEICLGTKSPDKDRKRQKLDEETTLVTEFDCTIGTDRPGDP